MSTLLALVLSTVSLAGSDPTTWFVDAAAVSPGLGTPDAPYASIQAALASPGTVDGDTILVAPGTYEELVDFLGKDVVLASTDGPEATIIDASTQFSLEQSAVKIQSGEGPDCVLRGFTLRGGQGTEVLEPVFGALFFAGGGILAIGSAPTIRDCIVVDNHCAIGGGFYGDGTRAVLEGCSIEGNTTTFFGAGIHLHESDVRLLDVEIRNNSAQAQNGGGVNLFGGTLDAIGCDLDGNTSFSGGSGGNLAADLGAHVRLTCVTVQNGFTLDGNGGGLWASASEIEIEGCLFRSNACGDSASNREGGGLYVSGGSVRIAGSAFLENRGGRGGALFLSGCMADLRRTYLARNAISSGLNFAFTREAPWLRAGRS